MVNYLNKVWLIYIKDLRDEFRTLTNLISTIIFGLMLVFVFSLQLSNLDAKSVYPSLLWVIILFSATLGMVRSFAVEQENDVIEAIMMATGDSSCIFFAKFFGNFTLLLLVEVVIVPVFSIFMDIRTKLNVLLFLGTLILGSWGLALIGTLLNSITVQLRSSRLLLPILLFPISIPLLIAVVECTTAALIPGNMNPEKWIYFLVAFDLMFIALPLLLFNSIMEV